MALLPFLVVGIVLLVLFRQELTFSIGSSPRKSMGSESTVLELNRIKDCTFTEEYNRTVKRIVVSLTKKDTTLKHQHEILKRLPKYSEIIILVPLDNLAIIKDELKNKSYASRVRLQPYNSRPAKGDRCYLVFPEKDKLIQIDNGDNKVYQGSLWAQDLFEVLRKPDGKLLLLISDVHKWFGSSGEKSSSKIVSDNSYLGSLVSADLEIERIPITFDGGNILADIINGRRIVFLGSNVLRTTRTVRKSTTDSTFDNSQIIEFLKDIFNADQAVVIGGDTLQPPSLMFHLDQAVIFLHNGFACVTRIVEHHPDTGNSNAEIKQVKIFLEKLRNTLKSLGYRIVDIETSTRNLLNHQQYVNAIPYTDSETGQRVILMPVFPKTQTDFETGLVKKNTLAFESLGYSVIHVPTQADGINGGIHCLVNVLE